MVKRELSDIRFSQSETDRRTQDSLETVHNTLGHVVDRLAMIEGDLRAVAPRRPRRRRRAGRSRGRGAPRAAPPAMRRSRNPNCRIRAASIQAAFRRRPARIPRRRSRRRAGSAAAATRHQRNPGAPRRAAARCDRTGPAAGSSARAGTRPTARVSRPPSASPPRRARSAKSPRGRKKPVSTSSFIAAARRAAQAAAAQPVNEKAARAASKAAAKAKDKPKDGQEPSTITSRIRSLLVGASVVVIVLGTFKMAMTLLDTGSAPPVPTMENPSEPAFSAAPMQAPADNPRAGAAPQRPR
jgi:localization factor PodJL